MIYKTTFFLFVADIILMLDKINWSATGVKNASITKFMKKCSERSDVNSDVGVKNEWNKIHIFAIKS